jgi:hypothetical protein
LLRVALVIALSIAVWTFAEARSLTKATHSVTLVFSAPAGSDLIAWTGDKFERRLAVTLELEGSRAALDRASQRLEAPVELLIGDGVPASVGPQTVSLREVLREHSIFDRLAVSLIEVSPQSANIQVDEVVQRTLNVRVVASEADLEGPPIADPATVTVIGPASILAKGSIESLDAIVTATQRALLRSGTTTEIAGLAVTVPEPWRNPLVQVAPGTIKATIALRSTIESVDIPSVPVMVRLSPTQMQQWRVRIAPEDGYLRDVRVSGPAQAIAAIKDNRQRVVATLQLESVELSAGAATFEAVLSGQAPGLEFVVGDASVPVEVVSIEREPSGQPG